MAARRTRRPSEAIEDYAKAIYALARRGDGRRHQRAGRAARRHARVGVGDGQEARRARARRARAATRACADAGRASAWRWRSCATTGCSSSTWPSTSACRGIACTRRPRRSSTCSPRSSRRGSRPSSATRRTTRTATRSRPPTLEIEESDERRARRRSRSATAARFVRVSDSDPAMLRYLDRARRRASATSSRCSTRQPFDGPLTVRFGDELHVLGGALARAMRVERRPTSRAPFRWRRALLRRGLRRGFRVAAGDRAGADRGR